MFNKAAADQLEKLGSKFTLAFHAAGLNNLNNLWKAQRQRYRKVSQIGEYEGGKSPSAEWQDDMINLGDITLNLPEQKQRGGTLKALGTAAAIAGLTGVSGAGGAGFVWWLSQFNKPPAAEAPTFTDTDTAVDVSLPKGTQVDGP